jgi:hypothetical protein
MALHQRNDRGEFVNPAGGGPRPKLTVRRDADGNVEVVAPEESSPTHTEIRPDERPPDPGDTRPIVNPHHAGF